MTTADADGRPPQPFGRARPKRSARRTSSGLSRAGARLLAITGCLVTLLDIGVGLRWQVPWHLDPLQSLTMILLTLVASLTLFLGPGLALIHLGLLPRRWGLGLAILPGILLMAANGLLAWFLAKDVDPHLTAAAGAALVVVALLVAAVLPGRGRGLEHTDWAALTLILLVLLFGVARGTYSLGPDGDLYGGTISQTLEASNRPDSRISYLTVGLVANGKAPYSSRATKDLYAPYSFSSRGPMPGLAATPIVLISGAVVPLGVPPDSWQPFDRQGFAAYRIAMETMATLALLAVFSLGRVAGGRRTALFALLLAATTPFVIHEVYFTWPKLLAGALVLLSAQALLLRRPVAAGVFLGIGYLAHPLALTTLPALLLLWIIVVQRNPRWHRKVAWSVRGVLCTVGAAAVFYAAWQLVNWHHAAQSSEFLPAVTAAGIEYPAKSLAVWVSWRVNSLASTVVPLFVYFAHAHDPGFNPVFVPGQPIVLFFEQYWTSLPFAVGILFFPLYLYGLVRGFLRDWAVVTATVIVPFFAFLVYWGAEDTGLMREGLQAWLLGTMVVYAWVRRSSRRWPVGLERVLLATRVVETVLLVLLPTVQTSGVLVGHAFRVTDYVSLAVMLLAACGLLAAVFVVARPQRRRIRTTPAEIRLPDAKRVEARAPEIAPAPPVPNVGPNAFSELR